MIKSCKECMEGAPYDCCCKIECGQHEFCRGCKYTPQHKCYHEVSSNDDNLLDILKSDGDLKDVNIIPVERVLDDMYSDISGVSLAARDYYRMNYATEEEKIEMDEEDRIANKLTAIVLIIPAVMIITIIFYHLFFN